MAARLFSSLRCRTAGFARQYSASAEEHAQHIKANNMWKRLSLFGVPPALALTYYHAFYVSEHHRRPDFVEYEYIGIRTKPFPWGDGNHSLFHNPKMNAVPGVGYEEDEEHH